jgi:hypothetical protein
VGVLVCVAASLFVAAVLSGAAFWCSPRVLALSSALLCSPGCGALRGLCPQSVARESLFPRTPYAGASLCRPPMVLHPSLSRTHMPCRSTPAMQKLPSRSHSVHAALAVHAALSWRSPRRRAWPALCSVRLGQVRVEKRFRSRVCILAQRLISPGDVLCRHFLPLSPPSLHTRCFQLPPSRGCAVRSLGLRFLARVVLACAGPCAARVLGCAVPSWCWTPGEPQ